MDLIYLEECFAYDIIHNLHHVLLRILATRFSDRKKRNVKESDEPHYNSSQIYH